MISTIHIVATVFGMMVVAIIRKRNIQGMPRHRRQGWWGAAFLALILAFTGQTDLGAQEALSAGARSTDLSHLRATLGSLNGNEAATLGVAANIDCNFFSHEITS